MTALLANNATSKLASAITGADTTVVLTTGDGALFPSPTGSDWFPLTLQNSSYLEIVRVTARSGDSLTVVRAQEGTTALAFSAGDNTELRFTEAVFRDSLYVHPTGDGNEHVPANGTTNEGNVLTAGSVAGTYTWKPAAGGGLTNFTEALSTTAPNATVPVVSFTANNAATDVDAVLSPKGAGAISAQVADGTFAGGGKRGANAVDWQTSRSVSYNVAASDYSVIAGGSSNRVAAIYGFVGGGELNLASGPHAFVGGGGRNSATTWGTVAGGKEGAASASYAFVGGGNSCTASGPTSVVAGGHTNTASRSQSTVGGGVVNLASGYRSTIPGGAFADTQDVEGKYAYASGNFSSTGDCQRGSLTVRAATTDSTDTTATSSGGAASTDNQLVLQDNQMMTVRGQVAARRSVAQADEVAAFEFTCVVSRGSGAASTAVVGSPTITSLANTITGLAVTPFTLTSDTTNGGLAVTVTGVAATNIRWLTTLTTSEVIYA